MLTAEELKPNLIHEDRLVRDAVAEYFKDSWSRDPELVPLILESLRRYGAAEVRAPLAACRRFTVTERTIPLAIAALGEQEGSPAAFYLNETIATAPVSVIAADEATLLGAKGLDSETARRIHQRRELSSWPHEKLWRSLEELAEHSRDKHVGEIDHAWANDLIEALSRQSEPAAAKLCALLESDEGWLEIFVTDLLGARKIREAVPGLVGKFCIDADHLLERASQALIRIGDARAVEEIRIRYPSEDWNFRNYAIGALAGLKGPASEDALLSLLETERDPGLRVWLCLGLCQQFSEGGLEAVLREIGRGYEPGYASLEEEVLPVAELLSVELPEAGAWRAEAERKRARIAERAAELDALGSAWLADRAEGFDWLDEPSDTYRRPLPKVGRNQPCPCGSGRKYKKCCGRRV